MSSWAGKSTHSTQPDPGRGPSTHRAPPHQTALAAPPAAAAAGRVRATAEEAFDNSLVPFTRVAEGAPRSAAHPPVFQIMFTLAERAPFAARALGQVGAAWTCATGVPMGVGHGYGRPRCCSRVGTSVAGRCWAVVGRKRLSALLMADTFGVYNCH